MKNSACGLITERKMRKKTGKVNFRGINKIFFDHFRLNQIKKFYGKKNFELRNDFDQNRNQGFLEFKRNLS